jgi:hypothetical protein
MRLSATEVLRWHAIERHLRAGIRSVNLGDGFGVVERMSEARWVDSCALVRGVPAELLDVLGVRECEADESTWIEEAREVMGAPEWVATSQVARPMTLARAAARLGLALDYAELRKMRQAAIAVVTENQLRRQGAERSAA